MANEQNERPVKLGRRAFLASSLPALLSPCTAHSQGKPSYRILRANNSEILANMSSLGTAFSVDLPEALKTTPEISKETLSTTIELLLQQAGIKIVQGQDRFRVPTLNYSLNVLSIIGVPDLFCYTSELCLTDDVFSGRLLGAEIVSADIYRRVHYGSFPGTPGQISHVVDFITQLCREFVNDWLKARG